MDMISIPAHLQFLKIDEISVYHFSYVIANPSDPLTTSNISHFVICYIIPYYDIKKKKLYLWQKNMPGYIAEMLLKLALNTNQSIIKKKMEKDIRWHQRISIYI